MSRFDKVEPKGGSFRAPLAFAIAAEDVGVVVGVGLDVDGRVVRGAGQSGIKGVICPSSPASAGDPIDVMTDGEIVDMDGLAAGTSYFAAAADGAVGTVNTDTAVGFTVQAWRLVVRAAR